VLLFIAISASGQGSAELQQAKDSAISLIAAGDFDGADAATDSLIVDFADTQAKGAALHEIAGAYKASRQFDRTLELSQYVARTWPQADFAIWAQMEVALCNIELDEIASSQAAVDELTADYADDANLPWTLYVVAQRYDYGLMYEQAQQVYGLVAALPNAGDWGEKALLGARRVEIAALIDSGSWSLAMQELDLMFADFAEHPDMPEALSWIAQRLGWTRRYEEAEQVFDILITNYPDSSFAQGSYLWSARMNCCALIKAARDTDALAAIDALIADFSGDEGLAEALYWISQEYEWTGSTLEDRTTRYATPTSVYERLVQQFADSGFADKAAIDMKRLTHRTQIFTLMGTGEPNEVEPAIADMVADLNGQPTLVAELYWVGREYEEYPEKYASASRMYEQIIAQYPDSAEAGQARLDIPRLEIMSLIGANDVNAAEQAIDTFVADFNTIPYAAESLRRIATEYYLTADELRQQGLDKQSREYLQKARGVWGRIIDQMDESFPSTAVAYYFSGVVSRRLGEYEQAVDYFQTVADSWPHYQHAWSAQYFLGLCYEKLRQAGLVETAQADVLIEQAYEAALSRYGDSSVADNACLKLAEINLEKGQETTAAEYLRLFLELAEPGDRRIPSVEARLEQIETGGK